MDASLYKDYVLTLLFIKYVTDRYKGDKYAEVEIKNGGFDDLIAAKEKPDIGDRINKVIRKLAEDNKLTGIIDQADFDDDSKLGSGKDKVDKLTNLIAIFENESLDFKKNRAGGDDIIGDAYEYLMRNFATESGKSKGQFYTPAEVSRVMAKLIGIDGAVKSSETVYDPACGSGSLLIRAADEAPDGITLTIYGQEYDTATAGLAKMNLVLHNKSSGTIVQANTLSSPIYKGVDGSPERFNYAVANPPFSYKSWSNGISPENDVRFKDYGAYPPDKNGDFAWLLHFIYSLKPEKGKGAIILPHGVLFRGNAEAAIRKHILDEGYIKGIIGLPANLFYGTGIPACIIVIDKENCKSRRGIFMIDASRGFIKDGNKNRLREQDIRKITDCFNNQIKIEKYSRFVPFTEIADTNEYNLNIPRYINSGEDEDLQNIEAHLKGGIPALDIDGNDEESEGLKKYWNSFPSLRDALFKKSRKGFYNLRSENDDIRKVIFEHPEFQTYAKKVHAEFKKWEKAHYDIFTNLKPGVKPKAFIEKISGDILNQFKNITLLDKYDVYGCLMLYWEESMQDDVYAIAFDGWKSGKDIIPEYATKKDKDGKTKVTTKIKSYEGRLIPKSLIITEYFQDDQDAITRMEAERDEFTRQMEELREEQGGEDGLLNEVIENETIKKNDLKARIKVITDDPKSSDELAALRKYEALMEDEAGFNVAIKNSLKTLDDEVYDTYPKLTVDEIKDLVINKKWNAAIFDRIDTLFSGLSHYLTNRIIQLSERYAETLPQLEKHIDEYEDKVKSHLERMGFKW
jgi:type I restriction enzyme M protein